MAQADVVVVVAQVLEEEGAPHLHSRRPRCKESANPSCKWTHFHHPDRDHKKKRHPICSNSNVT